MPTIAGYSGVAIYTRNATCAPVRAEEGITGILTTPRSDVAYRDLPVDQRIGGYPQPGQLSDDIELSLLDSEGRCVILEFPAFVLLGIYSPATRDESRDDFRNAFFEALDVRVRNLTAEGKQVVLVGDLNVVRDEAESPNLIEMLAKQGISKEDWISLPTRRIFNQMLFGGTIIGARDTDKKTPILWDLCRYYHPGRSGMNTCWDTKKNTRPANLGSRIDYVLCSDAIRGWTVDSNIQEGLMGSDHCPVYAQFADTVETRAGRPVALLDVMNPSGMFSNGNRNRSWTMKDLLPLSAKLIPNFHRRQNIRDMFTRSAKSLLSATDQGESGNAQPAQQDYKLEKNAKNLISQKSVGLIETSPLRQTSVSDTKYAKQIMKKPSKRPFEVDNTNRVVKKGRLSSEHNVEVQGMASDQRTIKGFFKPSTTAFRDCSQRNVTKADEFSGSDETLPQERAKQLKRISLDQIPPTSPGPGLSFPGDDVGHLSESIIDPIVSKESWARLLSKRVPPRCEHGEICISLLTKKPGMNCGKSTHLGFKVLFKNTRSA